MQSYIRKKEAEGMSVSSKALMRSALRWYFQEHLERKKVIVRPSKLEKQHEPEKEHHWWRPHQTKSMLRLPDNATF